MFTSNPLLYYWTKTVFRFFFDFDIDIFFESIITTNMNIRLISSFVLFFLLIFGPLEVHGSGFSPRRSFLVPRIRSPPNHSSISRHSETRIRPHIIPRGGQDLDVFSDDDDDDDEIRKDEPGVGGFVRVIGTVTQVLISCGKAVLPPAVAGIKGIIGYKIAIY